MTTNVAADMADKLLEQTVNVVRAAEGMSGEVLAALVDLEKELIGDLEDVLGKTDFTLGRLRALLSQANAHIDAAYGNVAVMSKSGLVEVATISAKKTTAAMNQAIGASVTSVQWSPQQLEAIATKTIINGSPAGDWWAQQGDALSAKFGREMRMGQLRGETVDQLARRVRGTKAMGYADGIMQASRRQAQALVRTSALGVSNAARLDTYADNDEVVKGVQWLSTLDPRTCPICAALDGKAWEYPDGDGGADYNKYQPVEDQHDKQFEPPPIHFNCRCVCIPITYSWAELAAEHGNTTAARIADKVPKGSRAAMDGEVAASMSFDQWLQTKSPAFQDEVLGAGRAALWRKGDLTLSGLTDQSNNPLTLKQLGAGAEPAPTPASAAKIAMIEATISKTTPLKVGTSSGGMEIIDMSDGTKAIFKPEKGEDYDLSDTVRASGSAPRYWEREVAASDIADMIGMDDLVPPTVEKEVGGLVGSLQAWVKDAEVAFNETLKRKFGASDLDLARSAAWDWLIGNTDRHAGNWMITKAGKELRLIDNGLSFPTENFEFKSHLFREARRRELGKLLPEFIPDWLDKLPEIERYLRDAGFLQSEIDGVATRLRQLASTDDFNTLKY